MKYENTLELVLHHGERRGDRTGTGTISLFSPPPMVFDMKDGFPLITTKKMFTRGIIEELLWFLRGDTNVRSLQEKGVHIWDGNYESHLNAKIEECVAKPEGDPSLSTLRSSLRAQLDDGDLGPIYGRQWRNWEAMTRTKSGLLVHHSVDQIASLIDDLVLSPMSRRHIVSAWNVADIPDMALPPCHCFFQCYVHGDKSLDLHMYQRSADMFLGVPFNIASYALLLHILCDQTGYKPGKLIMTLGDAHIYQDHVEQVKEQLSRNPFAFPNLTIRHRDSVDSYEANDFVIEGYKCHPAIKARMSV